MKKVIIIGATSGIGRALTENYLQEGCRVGITGRREHLLNEIRQQEPDRIFTAVMDVTNREEAPNILKELISQMGGMDIIVVNAGIGDSVPTLEKEYQIIDTNLVGFLTITRTAFEYFKKNGPGTIAGMSSIAGARGFRIMTVYGATKRFISHYMEGLRHHIYRKKLPISIVDIRAGFIETDMTRGNPVVFWQIPVEKAVRKIAKAIRLKKKVAYVPGRWRFIYFLWRILPRWLAYKV